MMRSKVQVGLASFSLHFLNTLSHRRMCKERLPCPENFVCDKEENGNVGEVQREVQQPREMSLLQMEGKYYLMPIQDTKIRTFLADVILCSYL